MKEYIADKSDSVPIVGLADMIGKSGMNPKTLQYIMGHSDIGVTLNTYTHLQFEDALEEMKKVVG